MGGSSRVGYLISHGVQVYSIIARYRALLSASVVIPSVLSLHTITVEVVSPGPVIAGRSVFLSSVV